MKTRNSKLEIRVGPPGWVALRLTAPLRLILVLILCFCAFAQDLEITAAEYFWDTDPGLGNGTAISLTDVNTDSSWANVAAPAGALAAGMHKLYVRYLDDEGVWSAAEGQYIYIFGGGPASNFDARTITQAEYYFDNLAPTIIDVADNAEVDVAALANSAGIGYGLHRLFVRYLDEGGAWSGAEGRYIFVFQPWTSDYETVVVTQMEFHFDTLAPVIVDVADGETVNLAELASTAGLDFGLHRLYVRYLDDRGLWSGNEGRYIYIVGAQPTPLVADHLVGGEYWLDDDPGTGNGVPFATTDDGAWDEGDESVTFDLSAIPFGRHYIRLRFQDAFGVWTPMIEDTVFVGPILTIRRAGNSMVLDWMPADSTQGHPFHVWRADQSNGPFTEVASTDSLTWTDTNILNTSLRQYYHIRHTEPPPDLPLNLRVARERNEER